MTNDADEAPPVVNYAPTSRRPAGSRASAVDRLVLTTAHALLVVAGVAFVCPALLMLRRVHEEAAFVVVCCGPPAAFGGLCLAVAGRGLWRLWVIGVIG